MSNKEVKNFTRKLETGLRLAEKRMLEEKALRNETIVVSPAEGGSTCFVLDKDRTLYN